MRRLLLAGLTLILVTGCTSEPRSEAESAISWMDRVCTSIQQGAAGLSEPPTIDESTDPAAAKSNLVDYLGKLSRALDTVAIGLRNAGPPPVSGGQAAVDKAMNTITETKAAVDNARIKFQQLSVTNPKSFQAAITEAGATMQKLSNTEGPQKDLKANPDLAQAYAQASACKQLDAPA